MIFNWIQRFRHSKGYGVHSPFAFDFITNVVYEKHWYYAFTDLEYLLLSNGIDIHNYNFYHLSYRLITFFKPKTVLEMGFNNVVNTLFICHPDKELLCYSLGNDHQTEVLSTKLLAGIGRRAQFLNQLDKDIKVDSIFLDIKQDSFDVEEMLLRSNGDAFWVIQGIDTRLGRRLWKSIVRDSRVSITFDSKDVGIVLLNKSYKKQNYLI